MLGLAVVIYIFHQILKTKNVHVGWQSVLFSVHHLQKIWGKKNICCQVISVWAACFFLQAYSVQWNEKLFPVMIGDDSFMLCNLVKVIYQWSQFWILSPFLWKKKNVLQIDYKSTLLSLKVIFGLIECTIFLISIFLISL